MEPMICMRYGKTYTPEKSIDMKDKIIEILKEEEWPFPFDVTWARKVATRIDSLYSGGVSGKKYLEFDFEEGEVKVVTHPTPEPIEPIMSRISEGEIKQRAKADHCREKGFTYSNGETSWEEAWIRGAKWALSKGAKPISEDKAKKLTECYNCKEMVEMISLGEMCPNCTC